MTTLFITGGAGFIGANFIRYWLRQNPEDQIINFDLLTYAGNLSSLTDIVERYQSQYTFIQGDIGNFELVKYLLDRYRPDYLINFAAESHNSRAVLDPSIFYRTNVIGTQCLLEAARQTKINRFHHISTCEVYGDLSLESQEKFRENSPYRPRTPYNASKAAADLAVRAYYETFKLPITISNCANNYGPYQFPEKIIPFFAIRLLKKKRMPLYQSSRNRREWLHVDDHCRGIEMILKRGRVGETYNIGSGIELDIETIADKLLEIFQLDESYKSYVPDRPGHDRRYLLNSTKIERELGWKPRIGFEEGFLETINWYKANQEWWEPLLQKLQVVEEKWLCY